MGALARVETRAGAPRFLSGRAAACAQHRFELPARRGVVGVDFEGRAEVRHRVVGPAEQFVQFPPSFRLATVIGKTIPSEDLLRQADQALYRSKADGRNRAAHFVDIRTR